MRRTRVYRIKTKLCKTGLAVMLGLFLLSVWVVEYPSLIPLFVLALVVWVLTVIPAFYIEELTEE